MASKVTTGSSMEDEAPQAKPVDKGRLVQISFFLLGIGMLLPWNLFITATTFFGLRFEGSPFADNFSNFFSISYNLSNIVFLLLTSVLIERLTEKMRIVSALVVSTGIFAVLMILTQVYMDPSSFFGLVIVLVIISGGTTAALQSGVFAVSAEFPHEHTASVMSGQGLAGLAVSLVQILTLLVSDPNAEEDESSIELSALLYFLVAVVMLLTSLAAFFRMERLPFYQYYAHAGARAAREPREDSENAPLLSNARSVDGADGAGAPAPTASSYRQILSRIWPYAFAVGYIFVVTLAIFPGLVSNIESVNHESDSRLFNDMFVSFAFLLFNIGDMIGRWSAGVKVILKPKMLLPASLIRTVFFPIFLFCNVVLHDADGGEIPNDLLIFASDYVYWVFMMVFAISNGYIASTCMMLGPEQVPKEDREKAGVIMINALVIGLFLGSMGSFALRAVLCGCNPFIS